MDINKRLAAEFNIKLHQVENTVKLIDEGNTIPFISRYRKEATGSLNDEQLRNLHERLNYLRNLEEKKEQVLATIEEQGKLTEELKAQILAAETLVVVEDLYRPYKEKKKTKATEAIKLGLEPLADIMMSNPRLAKPRPKRHDNELVQNNAMAQALAGFKFETPQINEVDAASKEAYLEQVCAPFINEKVPTIEFVITNASYIVAERISDNADYRKVLRFNMFKKANIVSKIKKGASSTIPRAIVSNCFCPEEIASFQRFKHCSRR